MPYKSKEEPYVLKALQAIKILNGNLHHEYIRTGQEDGGLCAIHGIKELEAIC